MPRLTVYLLSKDRPALFQRALDSVLAQSGGDYRVVVSDNSDGDAVERLMRSRYPGVELVRRNPPVPALSHFRTLLEEATSEYIALFHDDDLMAKDYVVKMTEALDAHPEASAAGCNAWYLWDDVRSSRTFMGALTAPLVVRDVETLLAPYLAAHVLAPPPFPGYAYRRAAIRGLFLDSAEGGKYADVSFLMKVLGRGPLVWLPDPLMEYRLHSSNDTKRESVGQRLKLLRYIYKATAIRKGSALVREYRCRLYLRWWLSSARASRRRTPRRYAVVLRYLASAGPRALLGNPEIWRRIFRRGARVLGAAE